MATISSSKKLFFVIEGLPRSGTTILTNIFNSFENAFCFSEPLWQLIQDPYGIRLGKLEGKIWPPSVKADKMIPELKRIVETHNYSIGGIKETYRDWQSKCVDIVDDSELDFRIFILRSPEHNFSGWKKTPFGKEYYDVDIFSRNYKNFLERIETKSSKVPSYIIKYEELCAAEDTLSYIEEVFAGLLDVSGPLLLESTGYAYGDSVGNNSRAVLPARVDISNLEDFEIIACRKLDEAYNKVKSGKC